MLKRILNFEIPKKVVVIMTKKIFIYLKTIINGTRKLLTKDIIPDKHVPMTQLLILINIVVFILQCIDSQVTQTYIFRSNVWYSYLSACFLHGGINHIMYNMVFLAFICLPLEKKYGSKLILFSYIVTGIGGNLLFALYLPGHMALGASGSVCGLMTLWIFHNLLEDKHLLILPALFYICIQGIRSGTSLYIPSGTGYFAHYGAAIIAFFLLPIMIRKRICKCQ